MPLFKGTAQHGFLWDKASLPLLAEQLGLGGDRLLMEQRCGMLFITECVYSDILLAVTYICCFWGTDTPPPPPKHKLV